MTFAEMVVVDVIEGEQRLAVEKTDGFVVDGAASQEEADTGGWRAGDTFGRRNLFLSCMRKSGSAR